MKRYPLSTGVIGSSLIALSLIGGCAMADSQRGGAGVVHMKASEYFGDKGQVDLISALSDGDVQRARAAVGAGADVNAVGRDGMTPINWMLAKQDYRGLTLLLQLGANPGAIPPGQPDDNLEAPIHLAAIMEDGRFLAALVDAGAPVDARDSIGQTAIYKAILNRRNANVEFLLSRGADIDHQDKSSKTPINYAINVTHYAMALQLLRRGANPSIKNRWGYSAVDSLKRYEDRGASTPEDKAAYPVMVNELKDKGLW